MNIQPNNINFTGKKPPISKRISNAILNAIPEATFKDKAQAWDNFNKIMAKPAENRAIMGATAIVLQPTIDSMNKRVDEETRRVSICRTIAKIIAGTIVGIAVRGSSYKLVQKMTNLSSTGKYSKALLPEKYIKRFTQKPHELNNYRNALSTLMAVLAMCVTNFALDAPLSLWLTNKLKARGEKNG